MPISENIKNLRARYDITQKELAEIAGVTDKAVSTWELGIKEPRMGAIQKIADHFGIKKSNIIEENGMEIIENVGNSSELQGFSRRLREYMANHNNMTYEELSEITGYPAQTLSRYALGQRIPKITDFSEIASKLNVNPLWLQGFDTHEEPTIVSNDGLTDSQRELLKSLSKADLDIVLSVARQMKEREIQQGK